VLLSGWEPSASGDVVGMLTLFPRMLILVAGCIAFCAKQDENRCCSSAPSLQGFSNMARPAAIGDSSCDGVFSSAIATVTVAETQYAFRRISHGHVADLLFPRVKDTFS
jgi:hypothetical protein